MSKRIYLSSPHMSDEGYELEYINEAFEANWIAPLGKNVDLFEQEMKEYVNANYALALSSGTAAIHLGLKMLGVTQGDYVFCSTLTFSASCNPILYEKAIPVFIDSDESWNMSPIALQKAFDWAIRENKMPKAVIVVDLYGQSAKWDELLPICEKYNVPILEDAAEALGSTFKGEFCGTFGKYGILSFNGNKIITTSGGGMIFSETEKERNKMFKWATQSREPVRHYEHKEIGYNYRMSNISAGIGRGQIKVLDDHIAMKRNIYNYYKQNLVDLPIKFLEELKNSKSTHWLSCIVINDEANVEPADIINILSHENIESRPIWKPMHLQPIFENAISFSHYDDIFYSEVFYNKGICLPSDVNMNLEHLRDIVTLIKGCFHHENTNTSK